MMQGFPHSIHDALIFIIRRQTFNMVYGILNKLLAEGRLKSCSISVFHKGATGNRRMVFGREISRITRSHIEYTGGESGYEKLSVPLESVLEIGMEGRTVFRRKKTIRKIYPRA